MTSYNCLFIIAVCKRCKANLATLSKREPDLVDNDGDNSDDGNKGDDDDEKRKTVTIKSSRTGTLSCQNQ